MTSSDTVVGVIGLGTMGRPMAQHLMRAHGSLVITGRRRVYAELEQAGARWVSTPRDLAAQADVVLAMLPDLPQLEAALAGDDGLLAARSPFLLMVGSTSSAPALRMLAERLAAHDVRVVDTPVSGGEDGATAGTLSIMVGGSAPDAALAVDVLSACGHPIHLGPIGAGQVAKACNQLVVASTILALADATVLADRSGLDLDSLWDLLGGGYAGSNLLESRKRKLIDAEYTASGLARYMVKDLGFAGDIAEATETHPALLPVLRERFDELVAAGFGDDDIAVARRLVEQR